MHPILVMFKMIKCVIFDFDGVIVDSENSKFSNIRRVCSSHDLSLPEHEFRNFLGKKRGFFIRQAFPGMKEDLAESILSELRDLDEKSDERMPVPGIDELLIFLEGGYRIAVVTGSGRKIVTRVLEKAGIEKYFDLLITGDEIEASKPISDAFVECLRLLKIKPVDSIVIEDSVAGVTAAKSIGCYVIGLGTYLSAQELSAADRFCRSHADVLEFFRT